MQTYSYQNRWHVVALLVAAASFIAFSIYMTSGLTEPEEIGPFINGAFPSALQSRIDLTIGEGTAITALAMAPEPRGDRMFVAEQSGTIYTFIPGGDGLYQKTFFMDLTKRVWAGQDSGLLGLAFHPDFNALDSPSSSYFYVYYITQRNETQYFRLSRFSGNAVGDLDSEFILIEQELGPTLHRGGGLLFGNDGFLYLAVGELGWPEEAQDITKRFVGGVLRIDVDQRGGSISHPVRRTLDQVGKGTSGHGYYIPSDNPFLDEDGGQFEEYYSLGARNPHRMTKDRLTGLIYIGNVGSNSGDKREEVNRLVKGGNYGWPFREGTIDRPDLMPRPETIIGALIDPIHEYRHVSGDGCSVIGGFVYRGSAIPELRGKYILTDYCSKKVWSLSLIQPQESIKEELTLTEFNPVTFGEDQNGELYIGGGGVQPIMKLSLAVNGGVGGGEIPPLLSQTGVFSNINRLTPVEGIIPYTITAPLWSDGAVKHRWVAVPNDGSHNIPEEQVVYSEEEEWTYPRGAVFIKHFELALDERDPNNTRKLETRFLVHGDDGDYYGFTYRWNDEGTDAELLDDSVTEIFTITDSQGNTRQQPWLYPARSDCFVCHTSAAGTVLGPKSRQLNKDIYYPSTGLTGNQLESWNHIGIFDQDIDVGQLPGILTSYNLSDDAASLEQRARSYLDANCAGCHRPGGGPRSIFDLRLNISLDNSRVINGYVIEDLGIDGAKVIVPGDTNRSILYQRLKQVGTSTAMPPLAKNKVDAQAIELIKDWIMVLGELPVELVRFDGYYSENMVNLEWETASETNNAGFAVERRWDSVQEGTGNQEYTGRDALMYSWSQVGFVEGRGTTNRSATYRFSDGGQSHNSGDILEYRLKQIDFDGAFSYSEIVRIESKKPSEFALKGNYPNPFNPSTTIMYELPVESQINLLVFDLQGRLVQRLVDQQQRAGQYEVVFDANGLPSGTYFYRLQVGDRVYSNSMQLIK